MAEYLPDVVAPGGVATARAEKSRLSSSEEERARETKPEDDVADFAQRNDVFGSEEQHQIKYKTLSWPMVATLMIAEVVSNGVLSLPSGGGVIGVRSKFPAFEEW
jgi:hypothetical protein